jgi:hypothetical protein
MNLALHVMYVRQIINACKILVDKYKGNDLGVVGDNIQIAYESVNWVHLIQDRVHWRVLVNTVMNL